MSFPFSFWKRTGSWPRGTDGPLVIGSGEEVYLTGGDVKDYSSILIELGGNLYITGGTGRPTFIGCAGTCSMDGDVWLVDAELSGPFTRTAPDGYVMSYTLAQGSGGNGGADGVIANTGGEQANGNGGGGASFIGPGNSAGNTSGGDGAEGADDNTGYLAPGAGGVSLGEGGGSGQVANGNDYGYGAGGGGGRRGAHANSVYWKVGGATSGAGTFHAIGRDGGNGSSGGDAFTTNPGSLAVGAGGAGGGAGGSGGFVVIKYHVNNPINWAFDNNPGNGGAGGYPGGSYPPEGGEIFNGYFGWDGDVGYGGSFSISSY